MHLHMHLHLKYFYIRFVHVGFVHDEKRPIDRTLYAIRKYLANLHICISGAEWYALIMNILFSLPLKSI